MDTRVSLELPSELVDSIVDKVVQRMRAESVPESRWLCGAEAAAAYLDWPTARVYKNLRRLPHSRDGRRLMFNTADLDKYVSARYEGPSPFCPTALARSNLQRRIT